MPAVTDQGLDKVQLTPRQMEVFCFIGDFRVREMYAPSLDEIGAAVGGVTKVTVLEHVHHLVYKGLIETRRPHQRRGIAFTPTGQAFYRAVRDRRGLLQQDAEFVLKNCQAVESDKAFTHARAAVCRAAERVVKSLKGDRSE